jgi:hypothetical protein
MLSDFFKRYNLTNDQATSLISGLKDYIGMERELEHILDEISDTNEEDFKLWSNNLPYIKPGTDYITYFFNLLRKFDLHVILNDNWTFSIKAGDNAPQSFELNEILSEMYPTLYAIWVVLPESLITTALDDDKEYQEWIEVLRGHGCPDSYLEPSDYSNNMLCYARLTCEQTGFSASILQTLSLFTEEASINLDHREVFIPFLWNHLEYIEEFKNTTGHDISEVPHVLSDILDAHINNHDYLSVYYDYRHFDIAKFPDTDRMDLLGYIAGGIDR